MQTATSGSSDGRAIISGIVATTDKVQNRLLFEYASEVRRRGMELDTESCLGAIDHAAHWLTHPGYKPWLFLSGNCGTGKTTLLKSILRTLNAFGVPSWMFPASDFPALFLDNAELTERKLLQGDACRVLLLDDVGVEPRDIKSYGNVLQPFIRIVESRYNFRLPLVVSTNLSGAEMSTAYGERIMDRITEMSAAIIFDIKSYRKMQP